VEQSKKPAVKSRTLPEHREDPDKTAADQNEAIQQLEITLDAWKKMLEFMRSSQPDLLRPVKLSDSFKVQNI